MDKLINVSSWHPNIADGKLDKYYVGYKKKYSEEWNMLPHKSAVEMWAKAVDTAKTDEATAVAKALENMRYDAGTGPMWMRARIISSCMRCTPSGSPRPASLA